MKGYFITGTDTSIGKTYVLCQLFQFLQSQGQVPLAIKPVASGSVLWQGKLICEDELALRTLQPHLEAPVCGWTYDAPIAPHVAAKLKGEHLSAQAIAEWCQTRSAACKDTVLVEGAGGLLMPLNESESWVEVIRKLNIPVILVVGLRLGCMNHALLTDQVMHDEGLTVKGWIANHLSIDSWYEQETIETLKLKMRAAYLGEVKYQSHVPAMSLFCD